MADIKIMVVDDDVNICELLRLYLEKEGYDTVVMPDLMDMFVPVTDFMTEH